MREMIIIDANVLVALIDDADKLNARVLNDVRKISRSEPLRMTEAALSEACFLCKGNFFLERTLAVMDELKVELLEGQFLPRWRDILVWMQRYAEHNPEWADAQMAVISSQHRAIRIWTYDHEFRAIWRRMDGSKILLAV